MIYYFLLAVSIILTVSKSSLYNAYAKAANPSLRYVFLFNGLGYGGAAICALVALFFGGEISISTPTVLSALWYAVTVFALQSVSIFAMRVGAMALTAICVMYGMIIPALAGPIFWDEPFGILQGVGISLMILSLWLLKGDSGEKSAPVSKKWLILAFVAFILSGMSGLIEKIHQSTEGREEKSSFVFLACLMMFLISFISFFFTKRKATDEVSMRTLLSIAIPVGIVIGFHSTTNLTLAGALDSMIYYPVANGGAMLLTVLVSRVIFKELFTPAKLVGVAIGLAGIICLSLPI